MGNTWVVILILSKQNFPNKKRNILCRIVNNRKLYLKIIKIHNLYKNKNNNNNNKNISNVLHDLQFFVCIFVFNQPNTYALFSIQHSTLNKLNKKASHLL